MNNFSPLPASASDTRLSTPEAAAPVVSPALRERRQKLRRVVTWVVGGAVALMCVGLICGAVRAHSRAVALTEATAAAPPTPVSAPTPTALAPNSASPAADTSAVAVTAPPATSATPKPAKKPALHAKSKHSTAKSALAHH